MEAVVVHGSTPPSSGAEILLSQPQRQRAIGLSRARGSSSSGLHSQDRMKSRPPTAASRRKRVVTSEEPVQPPRTVSTSWIKKGKAKSSHATPVMVSDDTQSSEGETDVTTPKARRGTNSRLALTASPDELNIGPSGTTGKGRKMSPYDIVQARLNAASENKSKDKLKMTSSKLKKQPAPPIVRREDSFDELNFLSTPKAIPPASPSKRKALEQRNVNEHDATITTKQTKKGKYKKGRAVDIDNLSSDDDDDSQLRRQLQPKVPTVVVSPRRSKNGVARQASSPKSPPKLWQTISIRKKSEGQRTEEEVKELDEIHANMEMDRQERKHKMKLVNDANDFFSTMAGLDSKAERKQLKLANKVAKIADRRTSAGATQAAEVDADELYCASFRDMNNICQYCNEPLPKTFSDDLIQLQNNIKDGTIWRQTISFCTMHRAETTVIPLGERDGFPTVIDFDNLDQRLESGFIHDRLRRVIAKPHISKFFLRAQREIETMGLAKWKALANQGSESTLSIATPGYYGDLGRAIIIQHFQLLTKWGMMRPLSKDAILPLSTTDFIATVLVPEAAVLLIVEDQGWSGNPSGSRWKAAMREAMDIRTRSAEYGHWRFREDGVGQAVLARLKSAEEEKKRRVEEVEMRPGGEARPVVVSSASEMEFGEEEEGEGFWDEMERVAWVSEMRHTRFDDAGRPIMGNGGVGSASGGRGRSSSVSSTEDGWTIDPGEAVAKMDEVLREHARAG